MKKLNLTEATVLALEGKLLKENYNTIEDKLDRYGNLYILRTNFNKLCPDIIRFNLDSSFNNKTRYEYVDFNHDDRMWLIASGVLKAGEGLYYFNQESGVLEFDNDNTDSENETYYLNKEDADTYYGEILKDISEITLDDIAKEIGCTSDEIYLLTEKEFDYIRELYGVPMDKHIFKALENIAKKYGYEQEFKNSKYYSIVMKYINNKNN